MLKTMLKNSPLETNFHPFLKRLFFLALIPNLFFWILRKDYFFDRAFINLDYFLLAILSCFSRRLIFIFVFVFLFVGEHGKSWNQTSVVFLSLLYSSGSEISLANPPTINSNRMAGKAPEKAQRRRAVVYVEEPQTRATQRKGIYESLH